MQIQLSGPTAAGSGGASGGMAGPCLPTHLITSVNTQLSNLTSFHVCRVDKAYFGPDSVSNVWINQTKG